MEVKLHETYIFRRTGLKETGKEHNPHRRCPPEVFFEADIGQLEQVKFTEGLLLEVIGTKGVLRIDLPVETLRKVVEKTR